MTCFMRSLGQGPCEGRAKDGYCKAHREGAIDRAAWGEVILGYRRARPGSHGAMTRGSQTTGRKRES